MHVKPAVTEIRDVGSNQHAAADDGHGSFGNTCGKRGRQGNRENSSSPEPEDAELVMLPVSRNQRDHRREQHGYRERNVDPVHGQESEAERWNRGDQERRHQAVHEAQKRDQHPDCVAATNLGRMIVAQWRCSKARERWRVDALTAPLH